MNLGNRIKKCLEWKYLLDMMNLYSSWGWHHPGMAPCPPPYDPPLHLCFDAFRIYCHQKYHESLEEETVGPTPYHPTSNTRQTSFNESF